MVVKNGEEEELLQFNACKHFIEKFFERSYRYAFDKKYTIFDLRMQIKNYYEVCNNFGINNEFKDVKDISVNAIEKAFEELDFTSDRRKIFFRFVYTGPLVYNNCTELHQMPVGRNQWGTLFSQCQEC